MNDEDLERYARHILLPQVDVDGQRAIMHAKMMLVGLGGLGSAVSMYLAASGVGELILVDDDRVELSNLQRQIVHRESSLGLSKVLSAAKTIKELNSRVRVRCLEQRLGDDLDISTIIPGLSAVVDCTDSVASRENINRMCFTHKIPLISAAAIRFEAQLSTFDFGDPSSPCYRCLHDKLDDSQLSCSESGVFSPLLGVVGSMQALEALKIAAGLGPSLVGKLMMFDASNMHWQTLNFSKRQGCEICS